MGKDFSGRRPPARYMDPYHNRDEAEVPSDDRDDDRGGAIEGRNAVIEALRAGTKIDKVYIAKGDVDRTLGHIASAAREAGAVVSHVDRRKLDAMSVTHSHQGVIALTVLKDYVAISDILALAQGRGEPALIIVCDEISDPHNLGAIIRTAEAAGAHGVIIPKRRSAGVTGVVAKTSAGAAMHMAVARVANITAALKELKDAGVWIYGAAADGTAGIWQTDLTGAAAFVVGSEGTGMSRLVRENCDFLVNIPMCGKMSSLNASVSAAILMYEAVRQRGLR